jgi:glutamate-1-semialdehyde aminotransferase
LFEYGVYTTPAATLHSIVTLAHTDADVDFTLAVAEKALDALAVA